MAEIKDYLVSVRRYVKGLSVSEILAYKAFTEGEQWRLYCMLRNASNLARFHLTALNEEEIAFRLEKFSIDTNANEIVFSTPSGMSVRTDNMEILEVLQEYDNDKLFVQGKLCIRKGKPPFQNIKFYYLKDVKISVATKDEKSAKELLGQYTAVEILPYIFGYYQDTTVVALIIPRLLPIFQPFGYPIHVVYLSHPATGKSFIAKTICSLSNSYYLVTFPSRAKLIGDARWATFGLCNLYDAIYIDEVDKISPSKSAEFRETYDFLLMGMEFGVWQREKSSKVDISYERTVSICFMGNIPFDLSTYSVIITKEIGTNRLVLSDLIKGYEVNPDPFVQRIALVEIVPENIHIMQYINYDEHNNILFIHPAISRSVLELLQNEVNFVSKKVRRERSRYDRYVNAIYNVLKVLGIEIDEATIEKVVMGHESLFYVLRSGGKEEKKSEPTDLEKLIG